MKKLILALPLLLASFTINAVPMPELKLNTSKLTGYLQDNLIRPVSIQESSVNKNCYEFIGIRKYQEVTGRICPSEKFEYEIHEDS